VSREDTDEGELTEEEWIKLMSATSNAVCDSSSKKTISPEHVIEALKVCPFSMPVQSVACAYWGLCCCSEG
jgi:hypothetical protein